MPGKRSTTPLFDLLQQRRPRGVEVRVPEPEVERSATAAPSPDRSGGRFAEGPIRIVGGVIQMPLGYGAAALAVALTAILVAWVVGYNKGESRARSEQQMLESVMGPDSRIVEPGDTAQGGPTREAGNGPSSPSQPTGSGAPARFLTGAGGTDTDPRRPGHNYLHLAAKLEAESALSAIEHLKARGIDAFAEIDPETLRRKNGPLYTVIAARGVPGDEVDSADAKRYRAQILAAGTAWKQAGGKWDFADAYWSLHTPKGD